MTHIKEAPPVGRASEKRFDGQSKTFSEHSDEPRSSQGPRPIGEIAAKVFLDACESQILRQIEKLSNPAFGGSARVEARKYLAGLTVAYKEAAGHPFKLEDAA